MSGAVYAPVGPWWTLDAPSLRLPTGDGERVSIWTVGAGPSLLLVARSGADHRAWLPVLPHLQAEFTLHAVQRPRPGDPATAVRDIALAIEGLGVRWVVADGDAGAAVVEVMGASRLPSVAVLHAADPDVGTAAGGALTVHRLGSPGDRPGDDPAALAGQLRELLAG